MVPSPSPRRVQLLPCELDKILSTFPDANTSKHLSMIKQTGYCNSYFKGNQTSDKFPQMGILQNSRPALLKTVKVMKSKESLKNCQIQEEPDET